ncbi:MBL fold metallo-hydrolase [Candidatus Nitrosotenuis uzonensis]|uniref:Ribonuclease J protein n=1 Tax=Candidatus Nitrosotenuis uzonensis TaxID=1407055 RepID=A0A812ETA9_9ARCH|nr:MBL fold metallo-hydrolase [Candidatus Nitrosotenuis uzonensis]CAE6485828.1 Ribonuclease J protein [Candidatus Nitrosotenuis uzonensis]
MTSLTFYGGVKDIGGNKFLVEDRGTKIFMDFGMSFSAENQYFSEYLKARGSNSLIDMMELGLLPKIKGLYRRDYAKHMGFGGDEETEINAVLLTHAHVDHCAYIRYLRPDITIYCSEESKLIMQSFDDTGNGEQYLELTEKFGFHKSEKGSTKDLMVKDSGVKTPRKIQVFESNKKFNIDSIEVTPLPVDHSISGVHGFILATSEGMLANTADIRFHGRRTQDTEKFVEKCAESSLDLLLCEGTRINKTQSPTESDVENKVTEIVNDTEKLVICGYPTRDLDRLQSFYLAAKATGRDLAIEPRQAYLLQLFNSSSKLKGLYPSPTDKHIKIYIPKGEWGLIDKDISVYTRKLLDEDYKVWAREFLDYENKIDYRDVSAKQSQFMLSLSDFKLQELIDIKPNEGSSYIRSLTEPFDLEMEFKQKRIENWFTRFGLITSEKKWHQVHVSGHGDGNQIKIVIENSNSKKLIPIHTEPKNEVYHKKWHTNVQSVNPQDSVKL